MARPRSEGATVKHLPARVVAGRAAWQVRIYAGDGAARRPKDYYFATEAEAVALQHAIDVRLVTRPVVSTVSTAKAGTFAAFAQTWLDTVVVRKKPATARSYRLNLETHLLPTLGPLLLTDRTFGVEPIVRALAKAQQAGLSWGSQTTILRVLSSACTWAVRSRHLTTNPCSRLVPELRQTSSYASSPEPNPLTQAQADAFLAWLQQRAPEWHAYFLTLLRTGMRVGEATGLRWDLVDLDQVGGPRATLKWNFSPAAARASASGQDGDGPLKTNRPHVINLAPSVAAAWRELRRQQQAAALKAGRPASSYVFLTPTKGHRLRPDCNSAERIFHRGMAAIGAKAEGHTPHDLRDTFATLHLLADPGRLLWVSFMLGHRQPSTTTDRYARWIPTQAAGATFAGALDAPVSGFKIQS